MNIGEDDRFQDEKEPKYDQSERQIRIRDLEGSMGRLEAVGRMLSKEEDQCNNHTSELLESAMINVQNAITEYNEEIRRLEK